MKQATVRQLRQEFPKVLAWIQQGEEVQIVRRKRVVARLSPEPGNNRKVKLPDFLRRLEEVGKEDPVLSGDDLNDVMTASRGRW